MLLNISRLVRVNTHDSQSHTCSPANILLGSFSARCAATPNRQHATLDTRPTPEQHHASI
eukprot:6368312-Prymnesium_polylepis.1